ncbi:MAG: glycosyltransferase family 39 protein [Burkholderiales bacterium]|nr:glycosyltransferase family 39 protein [Burkholderiales bacterium]
MSRPTSSVPDRLTRWLWFVALASLATRLWVAVALPMTGDEALFYWWARFLDYGYYDHPPMVGWWIAASRTLLGDATWAVRITAVLLPLGVGGAIWWAWAPVNRERAAWAVLLFWLMPVNWLASLVTTDTPLIFWAAWSAAAMVRAEQRTDRVGDQGQSAWALYGLSGVFMALAFLSKYFAVLLGLGYALYFVAFQPRRWRGFVWMALAALPGVAINLIWNAHHCWTNIMFNLFNRNEDAVFSVDKPLTYLGMMAYLLSPVGVWLLWRYRREMWGVMKSQRLLACMAWVPLLCFGLMSGKKVIGLHWVLGFYPFLFVLLAWMLPLNRLPLAAKGLGAFLALHLLVAGVAGGLHLEQLQRFKFYHRLVEAARASDIVRQALAEGTVLMATAYSSASIYGYAAGQHVPVFGMGSVHARQDDLIVDYSKLNGRTLRIILDRAPNPGEFDPYFNQTRTIPIHESGADFYVVEGTGFRYSVYRDRIMQEINRRYYHFPAWLPVSGCAFCQHFCGQNRCDR